MHFSVKIPAASVVVAALALSCGVHSQAQSTAAATAGNGTYMVVDPLADVRYDNRYDLSLGAAYDHVKAGPNLLQGQTLGDSICLAPTGSASAGRRRVQSAAT